MKTWLTILIIGTIPLGFTPRGQLSLSSASPTFDTLPADIAWMQRMLDYWDYTCEKELHIEKKPLAWSIFFDSTIAWHINPDTLLIKTASHTSYTVIFNGQAYPVHKVNHAHQQLWIPERKPLPVNSFPTMAMPYAGTAKVLFIAPLFSWFQTVAPPDQAYYLQFLLLSNTIHELVHTCQLPYVLPQLMQLKNEAKLESLDDNTVEHLFSNNERYKQMLAAETKLLWNAVYTKDDDSSISLIKQVIPMIKQRKQQFFTGTKVALAKADDIFLSLEGSAMWAQYRVLRKETPNPNDEQLIAWLMERGGSWSQERGLQLALLFERFNPEWKKAFFEKPLPGATEFLETLLRDRVKEGNTGDHN